MAIEASEADHDLLGRNAHLLPVAQEDRDGPQQFAPVIAMARSPKSSQKRMGRGLQHDGPGAHDVPALASLMTCGAHVVKATVRSRQRLGLGQGALASDVPGAIHIGNEAGRLTPIADPTWIRTRLAGPQVFREQGTEVLDTGLIQCGSKAGQSGARGQKLAATEGQELVGKRPKALVNDVQGRFTGERVADEDHHNIDEIVGSHAGARSGPDR
jgi:hypothetical protein